MAHLREFVARQWPDVTTGPLAEDLNVQEILVYIRRQDPDVVIMMGGPPQPLLSARD